MTNHRFITSLITGFLFLFNLQFAHSCSTYKVTVGGKTMVGSNYDTWFESPRIWFETTGYGASFSGARQEGQNKFAPQTGMNEYGLAFVTLATATPENGIPPVNKMRIENRTNYLKDILHKCKNTDEAKAYIEQYDHSTLSQDVFFYVDRGGNYLVVEPYKILSGNEAKYVLANFCPSTINDFDEIKQVRYKKGVAYLQNKIDTSIEFCTSLSDTMHVCREKIGDGTLLTSILDLNDCDIYLNFYHDYNHQVKLNLKKKLLKGNHSFEIASLFPPNDEYKKLMTFKTPLNNSAMDSFLRLCLALFLFSAFAFLISYFKKRANIKLLLFALSLIMMYYVIVLATEIGIFYNPAPYKDYKFTMLNVAAYIPFLLLLLIVPLLVKNKNVFKNREWSFFPKWLFAVNNLTYIVLIILFSYWGLYNIFG